MASRLVAVVGALGGKLGNAGYKHVGEVNKCRGPKG